jgi:electron transfer flavoprotein beta subunit
VDALTGAVHDDPRGAGASDADQAALEWALRAAEAWDAEVLAVTAGPPAAEAVLRQALAVGAARAVRVDVASDATSAVVAAGLAPLVAECALTWCGDYSLDRGSGSVPGYLAAHLGAAQALGLVELCLQVPAGAPGEVLATRRLDRGRRERLHVRPAAVLSVEGSAARLRRATIASELASRTAPIEVGPGPAADAHLAHTTRPFRPRARTRPAPAGGSARERILALTDAMSAPSATPAMELQPPEAADRILAALSSWGYLDPP